MKSVLLIGLGVYGRYVAEELSKTKTQVLAVDKDKAQVDAILPLVTDARIGDCTDAGFLEKLGVQDFDVCIVGISGDMQASMEITFLLKSLGAKRVIARASADITERMLLRVGADEVVYPQKQAAAWTAIKYAYDSVMDYMDLNGEYAMFEIALPKGWKGKNLIELAPRQQYGMNVIGVRENGVLNMAFSAAARFKGNESILVVGVQENILKNVKD